MILWRISNHADLRGLGGVFRSGRWHHAGVPVVYLSESPALALLEVIANFDLAPTEFPDNYQLLEVDCGSVAALPLDDGQLPEEWTGHRALTRRIGSQWLASGASALLKVPSAVVARSWNYLLNPLHADAAYVIVRSSSRHPFDRRLTRGS
ncbi:MAG: RES family NAD+ phosphorylase [Gammaproteobacteria bacterium]|nr:RES family NAD+ phosphorylase [Gammaproteobacteria bacterium]